MDQIPDLAFWKSSLDELESQNQPVGYVSTIEKFTALFRHLCPQTAPRLQRELETCTKRSEKVLADLFDRIDLSDKNLLCSFLKCLHAFGYFRLTQVTYHIDQTIREDSNSIYSPTIEKVKWYAMEPLLPPAGSIGWKGIMNHCLVREDPDLSQTCLQLLSQKLHFYSIASHLDRYKVCSSQIQSSGERVARKLFELIRDVACEDERMVGLDEYLFNLLEPFTNSEQQTAIIEALLRDLFKPFLTQRSIDEGELTKLYRLINSCIMNVPNSQDIFITKLLDHMKCNLVRMKRRHSIESDPENGEPTWKTLIDDINRGEKLQTVLSKTGLVKISPKTLQIGYLSFWLQVVDKLLPQKTLTASNSLKVIGICSFLVVKTTAMSNHQITKHLSQTLAHTVECTSQIKLHKFFGSCSPTFLTELTKHVFEIYKTDTITVDVPLHDFYKSYLNRYLKCCTLKKVNLEPESLVEFVEAICDESICGEACRILQNIFLKELSECIDNFKTEKRISKEIMAVYLAVARMCSKRLHKFVKRYSFTKNEDDGALIEAGEFNDIIVSNEKRLLALSSLIFVLRIAIEGNDQETLDHYGDLMLKLFNAVESCFKDVVNSVQTGRVAPEGRLEPYLIKLIQLYIEHKELVSPYIQRDLVENLSNFLVHHEKAKIAQSNDTKALKKSVYSQLKSKLENLENQASTSSVDIFQVIINKQYNAVSDQSIGSYNETIREESCCTHGYSQRLHIVEEISATIADDSSPIHRHHLLEETVKWLEFCDPLDHPRFIYILSILQSLIPKNNPKTKAPSSDLFREALPRISCSLIRLCKSVELGPSIHAYKNSGSHRSNRSLQCCTYSSCIRMYTAIFQNYSPKIASSYMTDAMQICISANLIQYAKFSTRSHRSFIQLASAVANLLKSICMGRKEDEIVRCSLPIFIAVFSHLIRCIIVASDRQKLEVLPKQPNGSQDFSNRETQDVNSAIKIREEYEKRLELLAIDVGKCLNNVCTLRVKLVDHAPHLISTYIKDIQRASCPDHIKLHLNEGIFRVFNLVDAHQKDRRGEILEAGIQRKTTAGRASGSLFEMIHARLDQASREIFRDMHDNHNKFHRYVGRC